MEKGEGNVVSQKTSKIPKLWFSWDVMEVGREMKSSSYSPIVTEYQQDIPVNRMNLQPMIFHPLVMEGSSNKLSKYSEQFGAIPETNSLLDARENHQWLESMKYPFGYLGL